MIQAGGFVMTTTGEASGWGESIGFRAQKGGRK